MYRKSLLAITLASATALGSVAYAASNTGEAATTNGQATTQTSSASMTKVDKTADRDFTKLSKDGFAAFRDLRMARLAIFDGKTKEATKLLDQAKSSMQKASKDDTQFMKAADQITPPKGVSNDAAKAAMTRNDQSGSNDQMTTASTTSNASKGEGNSSSPIAWLPIDGRMSVGEDYSVTPEKTAAVKKANDSLKKGDRKDALDTLKLAGVDVQYAMVVAPLDLTRTQINTASKDMSAGKYYEANLALKKVEDAVMVDAVGTPTMTSAGSGTAKSAAVSAENAYANSASDKVPATDNSATN